MALRGTVPCFLPEGEFMRDTGPHLAAVQRDHTLLHELVGGGHAMMLAQVLLPASHHELPRRCIRSRNQQDQEGLLNGSRPPRKGKP